MNPYARLPFQKDGRSLINIMNLSSHHAEMNKNIKIILVAILGGIIAAILIIFLPVFFSKAPQDTIIRIPKNATIENVRDSLALHLGPDYTSNVMKIVRLTGGDFTNRHGAYLISKDMSPLRAERKLTRGAQQPLTITINGFRSLPAMAERIARRLDFTADSLLVQATSPEMLRDYGLTPPQALAFFIDDSYEVFWSASPEELLNKIGKNYKKVWNEERTKKAQALGFTPAEIMIICSIIDEETNKLDEKGKIGRLYMNRLHKNMPLQADPTVRFALNDFTIRRVKGDHLKADSPYNTYRNQGLPPGPIRTTNVATIDALLNSSPSDDIYMCAKEDFSGYHNFAATYDQHMANARRYQKALNERGIQ